MSRRLKHCADEIVLMVKHLFSPEPDLETRLKTFRNGLLLLSESSLEHWRKDLERLWSQHDFGTDTAAQFFSRCREIYEDVTGTPA